MVVLSLSGGIIFFLPFLQELYYRPLTEALNLTNTEVGSLLSIFGATSLLCYVPGGWLADRVSPRILISASLMMTGISGLYFSTFPSYGVSLAIHALWGVTITLLFWCAMLRVTRSWGAVTDQGRAYGTLEMGRGLGELISASATLALFIYLGSDKVALSAVIIMFSLIIIGLGVLSFFTIQGDAGGPLNRISDSPMSLDSVMQVLRMKQVWLITLIVFCGYCAYWGTLRLTSYSTDIFFMSAALAALLSSGKLWVKPFAAFGIGVLADRYGVARTIFSLFIVLLLAFLIFAFLPGSANFLPIMIANVAVASIAVFGIRGIYYALLEETGVPFEMTGVATGVICMVGLSPDIFMPLVGGMLIDAHPGPLGYRYFFLIVAGLCLVGVAAGALVTRVWTHDDSIRRP